MTSLLRALLLLGILAVGTNLQAQMTNDGYPALPKYPRGLTHFKKDYGTKPGSQANDGDPESATYKVIHYTAYGLRVLVRAKCSTRIKEEELRKLADQYSYESGPPVVLDYESTGKEKVTLWAVASASKMTSTYTLSAGNGKYMITNIQKSESTEWKVEKIRLPISGSSCYSEAEEPFRNIRTGLLNFLTTATMRFFRGG